MVVSDQAASPPSELVTPVTAKADSSAKEARSINFSAEGSDGSNNSILGLEVMISQFDTLDIDVKNYGIYGNWTKQEFL